MLDYAFIAQGLHSMQLGVFAYNPGAVRAYEHAGFRHAGVQQQNHMMGGRLWDTILMDALAIEFECPVLQRVMLGDTVAGEGRDADSGPGTAVRVRPQPAT